MHVEVRVAAENFDGPLYDCFSPFVVRCSGRRRWRDSLSPQRGGTGRDKQEGKRKTFSIYHFPFFISHFSFSPPGVLSLPLAKEANPSRDQWQMRWEMTYGKSCLCLLSIRRAILLTRKEGVSMKPSH